LADDNSLKLFGFEISRARNEKKKEQLPSIVPPLDDDGAGYVTAAGSHYGSYIDLTGDKAKDDKDLIRQYRTVAMHPEVDGAIEDIVNEVISGEDDIVELNLDEIETTDSIKKQIKEEFDNVLSMLDFKNYAHDIFRRYYIDGRIYHHLVVDPKNPTNGIQEVRPIDSVKIRKVKEVKKEKDPATGVDIVKKVDEYFLYSDTNQTRFENTMKGGTTVKIYPDAISYVTSGLLDSTKKKVVSYLHKALKPINQLRMMEDALVIYRLSRAPERRIFYVDVGNLPRGKAEQYLKDIMTRYRNKLVYDANTGDLKNDSKHMSMLEDFWLPRREGGRGTEVSTLPGGQNLGEIDDILYFQKKLYKALNVPVGRLDPEQAGGGILGRTTEITRDEFKFQKFIDRLRRRFSELFYNILKKQLLLKGIITEEDWNEWKNDITVEYITDNYFTELKETEILRERLNMLRDLEPYLGTFYSKEWTQKNVLMLSDDDIKTMTDQIDKEKKSGEIEEPVAEEAEPEIDVTKTKEEQVSTKSAITEQLEQESLLAEIDLINKLAESLEE